MQICWWVVRRQVIKTTYNNTTERINQESKKKYSRQLVASKVSHRKIKEHCLKLFDWFYWRRS
jgi:hypothetical protein